MKRAVIGLERKVHRNQELRVKHSDDPSKFMESEIELFEEINKLQAVATAPELYVEFVKLNGVSKVISLATQTFAANADWASVGQCLSEALADAWRHAAAAGHTRTHNMYITRWWSSWTTRTWTLRWRQWI